MTATAPSSGTTAEYARLAQATGRAEDDLFEVESLVRVGSLPLRACLGHRTGGLQRQRRRLEFLSP
jgi:hypothetical protein